MTLDKTTSDYMVTPGWTVTLEVGPFGFCLDTADGGSFVWAFTLGRFYIGWQIGGDL